MVMSNLNRKPNSDPKSVNVLSLLTKPEWLVEGELTGLNWVVQTDDGSKKRNSSETIRFDVPIYPGPILLSDDEAAHDLLTAKLLVYWSLHTSVGWSKSAGVAHGLYRYFLTFVRWKWNRGIRYNADLTPEWLREFQLSLTNKGLEGLVRSEEAIEGVLKHLSSNQEAIPIRVVGGSPVLERAKIYELAGLTTRQQVTDEANQSISKFAKKFELSEQTTANKQVQLKQNYTGKKNIRKKRLHASHLGGYLSVWQRLWQLRTKVTHDSLSFEPFEDRKAVGVVARVLENRVASRTPTPPVDQTCFLIDRAIRWVLYYSTDIQRFVRAVEVAFEKQYIRRQPDAIAFVQDTFKPRFEGEEFPATPWPIVGLRNSRSEEDTGTPLYTVMFGHLAVACAIVVAAFSARRKEEIESLVEGCLSKIDGDYFLEVWIEKTLRHFERIPVPNIVAKAIEVLKWLSEAHRKRLGTNWLFEFDTIIPFKGMSRTAGFNFARSLRDFSIFVEVPPLANGMFWHFTPHQFRRFFSIIYFYRYKQSSFTALTEFLKHFNPESTRQYITEMAHGSFGRLAEHSKADQSVRKAVQESALRSLDEFAETANQFKFETLKAAFTGVEKMGGFGGDKLVAQLEQSVKEAGIDIRIGSKPSDDNSITLDEVIAAFAKRCTIEPRAFGHSYCKCSTSQLDMEVAACVKSGKGRETQISGPDSRFATDQTCSKCVHNVQLPENEKYWRELIESQIQQISQAQEGLAKQVHERRLELAKGHYERVFGNLKDGGQDEQA